MLHSCLRWQLKYLRVATRFGLLSEVCLALLLLPILRGLAIFRLLGIQFEASVRYHTWVGTAMLTFATFHGGSTLFIWGVSHHIQDEVIHTLFVDTSNYEIPSHFNRSFHTTFLSALFGIAVLTCFLFSLGLYLLNNRYGNGRKQAGYTLQGRLLLSLGS